MDEKIKEGFAPDADKAFERQKPAPSAEKVFPDEVCVEVRLRFDPGDMVKVRNWYQNTRKELGDKFVADFPVERLVYEALAGGAVNPSIVAIRFISKDQILESPHA